MTLVKRAGLLCAFALAMPGIAVAQQAIEWKQTVTVPKGLNLPKDGKVDILGLELGDSYDEAKGKLAALLAEAPGKPTPAEPRTTREILERQARRDMGADDRPPMSEIKANMTFQTPGGSVNASYVGEMRMRRELPGAGPQKINEEIRVYLSAPPSGNQVIAIRRSIQYLNVDDQPSISELLERLGSKIKAPLQNLGIYDSSRLVRFQFDDGRGFVPQRRDPTCGIRYNIESAEFVEDVNNAQDCDVVLDLTINFGNSTNHARTIEFALSDNERAKQTARADFKFFQDYVNGVTARPRGAGPKL